LTGTPRALARSILLHVIQPALRFLPKPADKRDILLVCHNALTAEYLADVWNVLKADHRLRFWLLGPFVEERQGADDFVRSVLPLPRIRARRVYARKWDLVMAADHVSGVPLDDIFDRRRWPTLRIPHGVPGKRLDGELYAFGRHALDDDGNIRYTRMFVASENEKEMAVAINPRYEDVVAVVGSLQEDRLLEMARRRDTVRRQLGLGPDETVVFVLSTWGPNALFNIMGDALLGEMRRNLSAFRFMLSVHPWEYRPKPEGGRVWGEYLRTLGSEGFIIRDAGEDWMPYMAACDVILADHTALALHGVMLGRPFVYSPVPDQVVEKGSVIGDLMSISPRLKANASNLKDGLLEALNGYPAAKLKHISLKLNSLPGQAEPRVKDEVYRLVNLNRPDGPQ
jgi:hypothetical protein